MPNIEAILTPQTIRPRVVLDQALLIGPGKVDLLRAVAQHGSISAARRDQGMTYRRAWSLLNEVNKAFGVPCVESNAALKRRAVALGFQIAPAVVMA